MGPRKSIFSAALRGESWLPPTNRVMVYIAAIALVGMMLVTVADVVGRYFFDSPIRGAYELVGFLLVWAGSWGMGYCQIQRGHIRVDFLAQRMPKKTQDILTVLANLLGFIAFSLLTWRVILLVKYYLSLTKGSHTDTLGIPIFPFVIMLAIGLGMLALVLLFDLIHSFSEVKRK
jgi:TRAP-type C4-dicarboxylate transport system permease small subunit